MINLRGALYAASDLFHQWKEASADLAKIEGAIYYIKAIEMVRRILIAAFFLLGALVMGIFGIVMLHVLFLFFLPFSQTGKIWAAFGLAVFDFLAAASVFAFIFSQKKWLMFTKASDMVENVMANNTTHREL